MLPCSDARLRKALLRHAPVGSGVEPRLHAALAQLAMQPGKLLRARLMMAAAEAHGMSRSSAEALACAIEFFHLASLVLDDLPCMDDAVMRRGRICVHRQHGEATAILAALALINRAYALVGMTFAGQSIRIRREATACLDSALGTSGLVGGQAWDLAFAQTDRSARTVSRIAGAKTGALFALTLLLPAALARPTRLERRQLRALAVYWGQEFQIVDDLHDVLATAGETGKTAQRDRVLARPNLALALGVDASTRRLARLRAQSERALARLERSGGRWSYLRRFREAFTAALRALPGHEETAAA